MKPRGPEAQLILLSAATAPRRADAHIEFELLCERVEWLRLQAMLAGRRLLPLFGARITEAAGDRVPERFTRAVAQATDDARRHGQFLQLLAARLTGALADAGIASLVLKGPALGELLYGDAGYRLGSDIDVLVSAEDLPGAVEAAVSFGYDWPADPVGADGLPVLHFTLTHAKGLLPDLELHWRVHWYEREFARDMLQRSTSSGDAARMPTAIDGFVSLLLYYARDGLIDVRLLSDLVAWWELFQADLKPGSLDETVRRYPALRRALLAALAAAESVTGLPADDLVSRSGRLKPRVRLAARLANPNPRQSLTQLHADVALVDWLLTPRGGQREFLRRQLLISRDVLEYRATRARREQVGSPLGHGGRVLARNVLAMPRMIRGIRR
jgi:hypothetical protein